MRNNVSFWMVFRNMSECGILWTGFDGLAMPLPNYRELFVACAVSVVAS